MVMAGNKSNEGTVLSESDQHSFQGIVPAVFTPFLPNGDVNLPMIPKVVDYLHGQGVSGLYVLGSTGEGISLTSDERQVVASSYIESARDRLPVIVQVGHNSIREACHLAEHAESAGAFALSAVSPTYFVPRSLGTLIDCMAEIASAAPTLPFYYYHIPHLTSVAFSMLDFLRLAGDRIPTLRGIKFTSTDLHEYQTCVNFENGRFDVLYGRDEMFLSALSVGGRGAVGSTFNLLAPIFHRVQECVSRNDWVEARQAQAKAVAIIQVLVDHQVLPACKAVMKMIGVDCGDCRLPLDILSPEETQVLKRELEVAGFFQVPSNGVPATGELPTVAFTPVDEKR